MAITFTEACAVVLPSGQYKGKTLGDVGVTGDGLLYLDWLSGSHSTPGEIVAALEVYLADDSIRSELDTLTGWKG